jgi:hypothetical protein
MRKPKFRDSEIKAMTQEQRLLSRDLHVFSVSRGPLTVGPRPAKKVGSARRYSKSLPGQGMELMRAYQPSDISFEVWGDLEREAAEARLDHLRIHYEHSAHPAIPWAAYAECRRHGVEVPEWALRYMDDVARNFEIPTRGSTTSAKYAAEVLGFKKPGKDGRGNPFEWRDLAGRALALRVLLHLRSGKEKAACEIVAAELLGPGATDEQIRGKASTVRRAWKKHAWQFQEVVDKLKPQ